MLTKFLETHVYATNKLNSRYPSKLEITQLKDNAEREPNIRIRRIPNWYYGKTAEYMGIYTYVGYQALSKVLEHPLHIVSRVTQSPDSTLINDFKDYNTTIRHDDCCSICYMTIAPSNLERSCVKNIRMEMGTSMHELDRQIYELSRHRILGITVSQDKQHILILLNLNEQFSQAFQIMSLPLIYRLMEVNEQEDVTKLFTELAEYYASLTLAKDAYDETEAIVLKGIFLEYIRNLKEYEYDNARELIKLLNNEKMKRLSKFQADVDNTRRTLQDSLLQVARAQHSYNEANQNYTAVLNQSTSDLEERVTETIDLLKRSKVILEHGIAEGNLWFTIYQPLHVNNPEEFKRLIPNLNITPKTKELVRKVFVDEEYELWTKVTVRLDLIRYRISRADSTYSIEAEHSIPQPHIAHFNCFGTHYELIANQISQNNLLEAVEQTIEACSELNWADSPVVNRLMHDITSSCSHISCFKTKDGRWFSHDEYAEGVINETTDTTDVDDISDGEEENGPIGQTI